MKRLKALAVLAAFSILNGCSNFDVPGAGGLPSTVIGSAKTQLDASWAPQWPAVVSLYHLDGSGSLANGAAIASAVGPALTAHNTPGTNFNYVASPLSQALEFNGVDEHYVDVPRPVQDDFTISFWMKSTQSDSYDPTTCVWWGGWGLVNADMSSTQDDFGINLCGGIIAYGTGNPDVTVRSTTHVNDGQWHHVAATRVRSLGTIKVYIDGNLEDTLTTAGTQSLTAPSVVRLGWMNSPYTSNYYAGLLDEVAFWNVALSDADVALLHSH